MLRKSLLVAAVIAAASTVTLACGDAGRSPTGVRSGPPGRMTLNAPSSATVQDQLDQLFPAGGPRNAATSQFASVAREMAAGRVDGARKKAIALINFTRQRQANGQLLDPNGPGTAPTTAEAADALVNSLFLFVGLTPSGLPPDVTDVDAAVGVVGPPGGTVLTGGDNPNAGVFFPAGVLPQYVTVTVDRLADPGPAVSYATIPYKQYALAFDIQTNPVVALQGKATVAVCTVEPPNAGAAPDPHRLLLAHVTGAASYELLDHVASDPNLPLLCDDARLVAFGDPPRPDGGIRLALWEAGRLGDRALRALTPTSAYAGHGGLLGQTTSFSPFVPVDTFAVASIIVAPGSVTLATGDTRTLSDTAKNALGANVTASVPAATWLSSDAAVATVSTDGVVTAAGPGTATVTATIEGVSGSAAITVSPTSGQAIESSTDAGCGTAPVCPDFVSTTASVDGQNLTLSFRFRPNAYVASASLVYATLDVDQNPGTGFPGLTSGGPTDASLIGGDYFVSFGPDAPSLATVTKATCPTPAPLPTPADPQSGCTFVTVGTVAATLVTDGVDIVIPRSLINETDGKMTYKATSQLVTAPAGYTAILDFITDVGSAPIGVAPPPPPIP